MQVPFVDLQIQHRELSVELHAAIDGVLGSGHFILGEAVDRFESAFARYVGARHAVGVGSGLSAIELALEAHGIGPGDEVITAANTYIATVLAISAVGAQPVLVDADPRTYVIDPAAAAAAVTPRTRAIVPVHLYGQPVDLEAIGAVARRHSLVIVEDAAQAHGARSRGRMIGSAGNTAAFSFYPSKNLGACGDGGMVVTDDERVAEKIRLLRNYGQRQKYLHALQGTNSRLDSLQAAFLAVKLPHLDRWNAARRRHAARYSSLLGSVVGTPAAAADVEHVYHLYVIETDRRDDMQKRLGAAGVQTGIHYPIPVHLQEAYASLGYRAGSFPVTEAAADRILSLPMYPELTDAQTAYVARQVQEALEVL
jgi:dTDP-4-amino-4,6-dideoxygalactose transaminase